LWRCAGCEDWPRCSRDCDAARTGLASGCVAAPNGCGLSWCWSTRLPEFNSTSKTIFVGALRCDEDGCGANSAARNSMHGVGRCCCKAACLLFARPPHPADGHTSNAGRDKYCTLPHNPRLVAGENGEFNLGQWQRPVRQLSEPLEVELAASEALAIIEAVDWSAFQSLPVRAPPAHLPKRCRCVVSHRCLRRAVCVCVCVCARAHASAIIDCGCYRYGRSLMLSVRCVTVATGKMCHWRYRSGRSLSCASGRSSCSARTAPRRPAGNILTHTHTGDKHTDTQDTQIHRYAHEGTDTRGCRRRHRHTDTQIHRYTNTLLPASLLGLSSL
jgi:hypothetical protein